jgi:hypothetical protein
MSKIQQLFEREKLKNSLMTEPIQMFAFPSELVEFIFATPVSEKIGDCVWNLRKGSVVSPIIVARTELNIDGVGPQMVYYGEFMEEQNTVDEFLCKGARMYVANADIFRGLRDYRGRVPATSDKPVLVRLDKLVDSYSPRVSGKVAAVGFLTSLSWIEKTDKVWLPPTSSDGASM